MLVQKILLTAVLASGLAVLSGCHDDFSYDYLTPPVTVTTDSDSGAHYGSDGSRSEAHYGNRSRSDAHYGARPAPRVSVAPSSESDVHYGN